MTAANVLAWCAQIAVVVIACAGLPRLLGVRSPGVQYAFWRTVLAVCLALPLLQPWRAHEMVFVPAPAPPVGASAGPAPAMPAGPAQTAPVDWTAIAGAVIGIGIAARLFWIALGAARLHRLRRRAEARPAAGFDDLQAAIGTRAQILWTSDVRHPVTFGVGDPVILLPDALRSADAAAQRAVLAHELAHVRRRDWLWVIGEEIVRSVFWFHPAVWWLVSRVQLARETVVDEMSILATNARRTYLDTLLAFADDTGLVSPPAFSARRHLFYRVMLLSKEGDMSSLRIAIASCVLIVVLGAGAWHAVQAFPLYGKGDVTQAAQQPPRDPTVQKAPPRDALSVVELHRQAVELFEKARADTTLTLDQKLETIKKGIAFEDRALEREPNYFAALVYKNILLRMQAQFTTDSPEQRDLIRQADELRNQALALQRAGAGFEPQPAPGDMSAPPPPPPPPPPAAPASALLLSPMFDANVARLHPIRVGANVKPPTKVRDVKPEYPDEARAKKVQGVVILEVLIDEDGSVADARILRSIPDFDEVALGAVKQWKFVPTLLNGQATALLMTVTVNFTLSEPVTGNR